MMLQGGLDDRRKWGWGYTLRLSFQLCRYVSPITKLHTQKLDEQRTPQIQHTRVQWSFEASTIPDYFVP